jgi:hypothetical protein
MSVKERRHMKPKFLLPLAVALLAYGKQVAYVDLTLPPKGPLPATGTFCGVGGGVFDGPPKPHPAPGTPTVGLRISKVRRYENPGGYPQGFIEVVMTNTARTSIQVPIGAEVDSLMSPGQPDRHRLVFAVTLSGRTRPAGFKSVASNAAHPETIATLQPGDAVIYKIPLAIPNPAPPGPNDKAPISNDKPLMVGVSAQAEGRVLVHGDDCSTAIGDEVYSENSVPLPPIEAPQK